MPEKSIFAHRKLIYRKLRIIPKMDRINSRATYVMTLVTTLLVSRIRLFLIYFDLFYYFVELLILIEIFGIFLNFKNISKINNQMFGGKLSLKILE